MARWFNFWYSLPRYARDCEFSCKVPVQKRTIDKAYTANVPQLELRTWNQKPRKVTEL